MKSKMLILKSKTLILKCKMLMLKSKMLLVKSNPAILLNQIWYWIILHLTLHTIELRFLVWANCNMTLDSVIYVDLPISISPGAPFCLLSSHFAKSHSIHPLCACANAYSLTPSLPSHSLPFTPHPSLFILFFLSSVLVLAYTHLYIHIYIYIYIYSFCLVSFFFLISV